MGHTLIVIRHAKSDWSQDLPDRQRPLAARGRRQAPAVGRWLADHHLVPEVVLVSPARRAQQTWELVAAELPAASGRPRHVRTDEGVYASSAPGLVEVIQGVPADTGSAALVGHNPALEQLVELLSGAHARLTTSAVAVLELGESDWASFAGGARLRAAGRPADDSMTVF